MKQPLHSTHDRLGRQVSAIVDGVSTNLFTYDALDLVSEMQNDTVITRGTDGLGRPAGFSLDEDYAVSYAYDMYGRFQSVTSATSAVSFTYSYLQNTDLLSGMTASSGYLWTRAYESGRSLITAVENRYGETVISRYDYTNDELGRRTSRADSGLAFAAQPTYGDPATVEMPAYNAYSYNTRSEVTGAARRWGTPDASGDLVLGQQYAYEFDPIGNRITSAEGDASRTASYTANALNQYTQRTVPDEKDLIGTAPTNVAVTVNQNAASRQSAYWHHALEVTNSASAAYPQVAITAVYNPPGTNDPDVVTSQTGHVFVAKTPESFTYDSDGNLTQDGRFTYTWNGENRLIKAETRDDLPASVPCVKVDYAYDHQGRRISSGTSVWTNDTWQAAESRFFVYDGWNAITEQVGRTVPGEPSTVATNLYVWGIDLSGALQGAGGIGGLLAGTFGGTTSVSSAFYSYDANGNVGQLVSTDSAILARYEYSPFGETVVSTGPLAKANPFRFSTKWFDNDTGLGYWGYRYYHPDMGRWLSRDPIEEWGGNNLYRFCRNSPLVLSDALGKIECEVFPIYNISDDEMKEKWEKYGACKDTGAFAKLAEFVLPLKKEEKCGGPGCRIVTEVTPPSCKFIVGFRKGLPLDTIPEYSKRSRRAHELRHVQHVATYLTAYEQVLKSHVGKCMTLDCMTAVREYDVATLGAFDAGREVLDATIDHEDYPPEYEEETSATLEKRKAAFATKKAEMDLAKTKMEATCRE